MSGDIINFRKAKKALDRKAKEKQAEINRIKFGRTKVARRKVAAEEEISRRRIDAHLRDRPAGVGGDADRPEAASAPDEDGPA